MSESKSIKVQNPRGILYVELAERLRELEAWADADRRSMKLQAEWILLQALDARKRQLAAVTEDVPGAA